MLTEWQKKITRSALQFAGESSSQGGVSLEGEGAKDGAVWLFSSAADNTFILWMTLKWMHWQSKA